MSGVHVEETKPIHCLPEVHGGKRLAARLRFEFAILDGGRVSVLTQ